MIIGSASQKRGAILNHLTAFIDDDYLNGQLGVTRAIGNWHICLKEIDNRKLVTFEC